MKPNILIRTLLVNAAFNLILMIAGIGLVYYGAKAKANNLMIAGFILVAFSYLRNRVLSRTYSLPNLKRIQKERQKGL
ncbi:MAG: hypothetical protein NTZ10_00470 [Candidatus Saganbacteria bacterium]|nr:hypothetical protein [Candidatus Saganbacteria bacterium]